MTTDPRNASRYDDLLIEKINDLESKLEKMQKSFSMLADDFEAPMHLTPKERKVFVEVLRKRYEKE